MGVKISGLTAKGATIADTDLVEVSQSAGGGTYVSRSVTGANIKALVTDANLTTTDVTTNDVSTSKHGFAPKAPNDTTKFLRGDGTWAVPAAGGLTKFTEAESTSSPNATIYVDSLTAAASSTDADAAIVPKGQGAFLLNIPSNNTSAWDVGGAKRGCYAIDLQRRRYNSSEIASGNFSVLLGGSRNTVSGYRALGGGGYQNVASGQDSTALGGGGNTASAYRSIAMGSGNTASAGNSVAFGYGNTSSNAFNGVGSGLFNTNSGYRANYIGGGRGNTTSSSYGFIGGGCGNTVNSADSAILGGKGNTTNSNSCAFIVGSNITADRACATFVNNLSIKNIPTASTGLPSGSVWSDSGTLKIV